MIPLILLALPLIEIAGFVVVGDYLGVWGTVGLTVATGLLGLFTLRFQVASLPGRAREAFSQNDPPVAEAMVELLRALGGVLLLIPGFFTDIVGLFLLVPITRLGVIYLILARLSAQRAEVDDTIIDGSYTDITPAPSDRRIEDEDEDKPADKEPPR